MGQTLALCAPLSNSASPKCPSAASLVYVSSSNESEHSVEKSSSRSSSQYTDSECGSDVSVASSSHTLAAEEISSTGQDFSATDSQAAGFVYPDTGAYFNEQAMTPLDPDASVDVSPRPLYSPRTPHDLDHTHHITCGDLDSCAAFARILQLLEWRQEHNHALAAKAIECGHDKLLLDDYQHILSDHFSQYKQMRTRVVRKIGSCAAAELCSAAKRYDDVKNKDLSKCDTATFMADFVDLIHCFMQHEHCVSK